MTEPTITIVQGEAAKPVSDERMEMIVEVLRTRRAERLRERGFPESRMAEDLVHLPWLVKSSNNLKDQVFNAGAVLNLLDKWADGEWDMEMFYRDCVDYNHIAERLRADTYENRITWDAEEIAKAKQFTEDANSCAMLAASSSELWCGRFETYEMPEDQRLAIADGKLSFLIKKWEAAGWGDYIPREPHRRVPELREPVSP